VARQLSDSHAAGTYTQTDNVNSASYPQWVDNSWTMAARLPALSTDWVNDEVKFT